MEQNIGAVLQAAESKKQVEVIPTAAVLPAAACHSLWMHLLFQKHSL